MADALTAVDVRLSRLEKFAGENAQPAAAAPLAYQAGNSPPQPVDIITSKREQLNILQKNYAEARARWFKSRAAIDKYSPTDPAFDGYMADLSFATEHMINIAETLIKAFKGIESQ